MRDKVMLLYSWGPEEATRAETLFYMAKSSAIMDLDTQIFLYTDGVTLAKKGVAEKISEKVAKALKDALEMGVKIYVCEAALRSKGINREDIIEGIPIIGYTTFLDLALKAKTVINV